MRAQFRFALLGLACLPTFAAAQVPAGFTSLFDGKTLDGWQGAIPISQRAKLSPEDLKVKQADADKKMREHWKVEDGALVNDGKGVNLASVKHFGNFEMLLDWKIKPKGDSGIYLRGNPQLQIWDSASLTNKAFEFAKNKGSGGLWNNKDEKDKLPLVNADNPPGQWNTFHVVMKGDRVTVKLNGHLVVDNVALPNYWEKGMPLPEAGPIELQFHPNQEGKADNLYFKNIYVKELPK